MEGAAPKEQIRIQTSDLRHTLTYLSGWDNVQNQPGRTAFCRSAGNGPCGWACGYSLKNKTIRPKLHLGHTQMLTYPIIFKITQWSMFTTIYSHIDCLLCWQSTQDLCRQKAQCQVQRRWDRDASRNLSIPGSLALMGPWGHGPDTVPRRYRHRTARERWKKINQAQNSKDSLRYLLHNEFTRDHFAKTTKAKFPETTRATQKQLKEHTRPCGKIVGRFLGRGDKPTEPGDSWLSKIES